ncbi:NAD(P)H-binding protein [Frankia sp. AiPs1]|uniref:NAD(P)H-binding protein n=1 Tax=Frankia sp. AiPs1 TaxID=573493 RepID=UPI002042C13D|nr:NAD(P)H-binding protein [Frankia sp. AiPs1]MCM3921228.1 NAD(P)H-binding protein [Frankia sp. AiPs1]
MILVTGATGTVGGEVLRLLVDRGAPIRAMTREPARLRLPADALIDVVQADFDRADSLHRAVAGVDSVFLLTAPGAAGSVAEHDLAMIRAARAGGVRKVVKLSAIGGKADDAADLPSLRHRAGEQALAASGLTWSALRPSSFASNTLSWSDAIRAGNPVPNLTGTGAQGVVDPRDVAAVAVEALLTDEHDDAAHTLTGPELLSVPDQVAQLAAELGRTITTVEVPPHAVRQQLVSAGFEPSVADSAVDGYQLVRDGGNAVLTDDVERILGHPARAFRAWAHDHRAAFVAGEEYP